MAGGPTPTASMAELQPPVRVLQWSSRTLSYLERVDGLELTMLRIPAGRFLMGSPETESGRDLDEGLQNEVSLGEFLMAHTPITQAQWRVVAQWKPPNGKMWGRDLKPDPSWFKGKEARLLDGEASTEMRPVERVSWFDAMEFCSRLSQRTGRTYTLPSEAQWEYACRAGTTTAFAFGATITPELANYRASVPYGNGPTGEDRQQSTPVGSFPANAWGLHEMHGNVWEWCLDHWHASYEGAPGEGSAWLDPQAPEQAERVLRGGAWSDPPADLRSACRYRLPPAVDAEGYVGFRVVCLQASFSEVGDRMKPVDQEAETTILWVDDNPGNNKEERALLERLGITILLAVSTGDALAILENQPIDLIISDMSRPSDSSAGLGLLRRVRDRNGEIPIVFYVGVVKPGMAAQVRSQGALAITNRKDELLSIVQTTLQPRMTRSRVSRSYAKRLK